MGNLFKLTYNEIFKIYIQKSTWAMYILLAILLIGLGILSNTMGDYTDYTEENWRTELQAENEKLTEEMEQDEFMQGYNSSVIAKNNYYLENDIQPVGYGAWQFVMENQLFLSIVSLFTIVVAGGIIANEFRWGTIKLLLIRPISRSKILLSKFIAVLLFALVTLVFVIVLSFIIGALFFGIEGLNPSIVIEGANGLEYVSVLGQVASGYGFKLINLVMMATFAFMISSIFRNSALAIGLAVFLMMAGSSIVSFFADKEWAKYILFANTDLSQYANGAEPWIEGMSLSFSVTMLIIYFIVFVVAAWSVFTKRDVAGN
ncbi:ABC transporter permease [Oceanobacillus piezotolerans]|uniref:ABC transporter permease n=1 Tax=Oceanobacillus piezotolerans TaxID=2448030 RepID=A0A498DEN2_9BACI|nr:ABC transporter permease [Oceanobacillus piezotolerans]RLL45444.1 ABC transporter permease [Oceanobacillus piezotolerans]